MQKCCLLLRNIEETPSTKHFIEDIYHDAITRRSWKSIFHKHTCTAERKDQIMTQEELESFAVDVLMEECQKCGMNIKRMHSL